MANLEKEVRRRERYGKIERIILGTILAAGGIGLLLVAPNALQALKLFGLGRNSRSGFYKASTRLVQKGLITFEETRRGRHIRITSKGQRILTQLGAGLSLVAQHKRWDGKWRMVIFDVPESKRRVRDRVRFLLVAIGFLRLQNSVWVYPYDCEEVITLIKADMRIGKDVLYIIADAIENDKNIKAHFKLH